MFAHVTNFFKICWTYFASSTADIIFTHLDLMMEIVASAHMNIYPVSSIWYTALMSGSSESGGPLIRAGDGLRTTCGIEIKGFVLPQYPTLLEKMLYHPFNMALDVLLAVHSYPILHLPSPDADSRSYQGFSPVPQTFLWPIFPFPNAASLISKFPSPNSKSHRISEMSLLP